MNKKTAKLIREFANATATPIRETKRKWYQVPRPRRSFLRRFIKDTLEETK